MGSSLKENTPKVVLGLTILFTYSLLVLGNLVTTTGSGLDCPDWPLCHGTVIPPANIGIWIEWSHRLLGGVTGTLIIFSSIYILKRTSGGIKFFMKAVLVLIVTVVLLGGAVVLIEAPFLDTLLRITVVSSHIVIAALIFVLLVISYRPIARGTEEPPKDKYQLWLFGIVATQAIIGVLVRYSNSSLACPDWPLCQGAILPPSLLPEVLVHYTHRLVAYIILGLTGYQLYVSLNAKSPRAVTDAITFGAVSAQATLGVLIVLTEMFLPILVLHGATAFFILGWSAWLAAPLIVTGKEVKA